MGAPGMQNPGMRPDMPNTGQMRKVMTTQQLVNSGVRSRTAKQPVGPSGGLGINKRGSTKAKRPIKGVKHAKKPFTK